MSSNYEAYNSFLHEQKMLQNKLEFREKNRLISIKRIAAQKEAEKPEGDMIRKFRKKQTSYRWFVLCPGCDGWSFLSKFKKKDGVYFCPKADCSYEIQKNRIWKFS